MAEDQKPQTAEDAPKDVSEQAQAEKDYHDAQGVDEKPSAGEARGTGTDA